MHSLWQILLLLLLQALIPSELSAEFGSLPEPDLNDGFSLSITREYWRLAEKIPDARLNSPFREISKANLLLRLPMRARSSRSTERDVLQQIVTNAISAMEKRVINLSNVLTQITFEKNSLRGFFKNQQELNSITVLNPDEYERMQVVLPSMAIWLPAKATSNKFEVRVLAHSLSVFGGIVPISVVFDEKASQPEIRVRMDSRTLPRTFFMKGHQLTAYFGDNDPSKIETCFAVVWNPLAWSENVDGAR